MAKLAIFVVVVCLSLVVLSSVVTSGPVGVSLVSATERVEIVRSSSADWADELPQCDLWCVLDLLPAVGK